MVLGMDVIADLVAHDRAGVDYVAAAVGVSADSLIDAGVAPDRAAQLVVAARMLYAPTSHSRYQARAVAGARECGHRVDTLAYIARASRSITDATNRWRFIETLCATSGDLACVRRVAGQLKRELSPAPARTPGVRVRQHGDGMATLKVTGPSLAVQGLFDAAKDDVVGWLSD